MRPLPLAIEHKEPKQQLAGRAGGVQLANPGHEDRPVDATQVPKHIGVDVAALVQPQHNTNGAQVRVTVPIPAVHARENPPPWPTA